MNQLELIFARLTPFLPRKPAAKPKFYKPLFFPSTASIPLTAQSYAFTYEIKPLQNVSYKHFENTVHFYGPVQKRKKLQAGMRRFLIDQARKHILPKVRAYADQTGLQYQTVRFKNQKSLWGSCSDLKNINFNIRLLFLPQALIDYVIIHELCHLVHMNHSKAFWQLVATHCPQHELLEKQLNQANRYIPKWIFAL